MSSSPSLIETLTDDSNHITSDDVRTQTDEPSTCEIECQLQQAALVTCMESIRQHQQSDEESSNGNINKCLGPAVASWTECCANANSKA